MHWVHFILVKSRSIWDKGVNVVDWCNGRLLWSCLAQKVRTFPHSLSVVRSYTLVGASVFFLGLSSQYGCPTFFMCPMICD